MRNMTEAVEILMLFLILRLLPHWLLWKYRIIENYGPNLQM